MDLERERTQLLKRDAEWATLGSSDHEIERILSYWTDDARVYPPGMPVISGKAALREYSWKEHWRSPAFTSPGPHQRPSSRQTANWRPS